MPEGPADSYLADYSATEGYECVNGCSSDPCLILPMILKFSVIYYVSADDTVVL